MRRYEWNRRTVLSACYESRKALFTRLLQLVRKSPASRGVLVGMNKLFLFAALILLAPAVASAQEKTPAVEVFGGYSYERGDEATHAIVDHVNLHGWEGSATFVVNRWLGIEADFDGHYGSDSAGVTIPSTFPGLPSIQADFDVDSRQHAFLFGPKLSFRGERVTPYAHALFGGVHRSRDFDVRTAIGSTDVSTVSFSDSDTAFGMALGGGVDVNLGDHVAIRAIQADYVQTRFDEGTIVTRTGQFDTEGTQHNARFSVGLVIRFGNR